MDPISSNVAALNLPLLGDRKLTAYMQAMQGKHAIITYGQLAAAHCDGPAGVACFSCENPSVLIAAERALGGECPPLLCTAGRPSDAVRLVFSVVHNAGAQIRHHGDFDKQACRSCVTSKIATRPRHGGSTPIAVRSAGGGAASPPELWSGVRQISRALAEGW